MGSFLDMACPVSHVCNFVKSICRRLFAIEHVWGSRHNLNVFMRSVDVFIRLGRSETITIQQLSSHYRTRDMPWLTGAGAGAGGDNGDGMHPTSDKGKRERDSLTCSEKRAKKRVKRPKSELCINRDSCVENITIASELHQHIVDDDDTNKYNIEVDDQHLLRWFLYWVFTDIVIPLLVSAFYVTEGEGTGTETLYFRKRDWHVLSSIGELQMQANFVKVICTSHRWLLSIGFMLQTNGILGMSHMSHDRKRARADSVAVRQESFYPIVRFVPKKNSIRAITNMSRHRHEVAGVSTRSHQTTLTNSSLYNCLYVLRHIVGKAEGVLGFGVDGVDEGCRLLRNFKLRVARQQQCKPEVNYNAYSIFNVLS